MCNFLLCKFLSFVNFEVFDQSGSKAGLDTVAFVNFETLHLAILGVSRLIFGKKFPLYECLTYLYDHYNHQFLFT